MHRDALDDTCVVYQNINLTNLCMNLLNGCLYSILVSYVADITLYVCNTCLLVVVQATLQSSIVNVVEDDVLNTCCNESLSNVETNTIRCAGNPGVLTL